MELKLTIDLDWISDEQTLDDTVKKEIINGVINKIQSSIFDKVEKEINKKINETTVKKINELTEDLFEDFTNKKITISDSYGDVFKVYDSVKDLIKERFDNFMTQTVDDNGRTYTGSYGKKQKRIYYIIDKQLKEFSDKFTQDAVQKVSAEIKRHVKDGLTTKLGEELMNVLKVDKMIGLNTGKK